MARRRLGALVVAGALVGALAACMPDDPGGNGKPTTEPATTEATTEPASSEPTTSDAPTPPDVDPPDAPEEMLVDDRAGAAAAAEYFFAVLDYARASGDTRQLEALSSPDCNYCQTMLDGVDAMREEGGWIETPGFDLREIRVQFPEDGSTEYLVRFVLASPELIAHRGDGTTEVVPAVEHPRFALGATWTANGFVVTGVDTDTDD